MITIGTRWIRFSAALATALLLAACAEDPDVAKQDHLRKGDEYAEQEKYSEAIIEYRTALQKDPRFGLAHARLAEAYVAAAEPARALASFVRAADLLPDDIEIQLKAGQALMLFRQYEEARARARAVLAANPDNVNALLLIANALAGLKNFEEALAANRRAISVAPKRVDLVVNLGALQFAHRMVEEAESSYRKAIELDPTSVPAAIGLADFFALAGRAQEAERQYLKALELDPTSILANRAVAVFYIDSGRLALAEPYLKKVAETALTAESLFDLAELNIAANRKAEGLQVLHLLRTRPQNFARASIKIASLAHADGYPAQALELLDEVFKKDPNDAAALALKAVILLQGRDRAEALRVADAAVKADPKSETAQYAYGMASLARGQTDEAKRAFAEVLKLNPNSTDALLELAEIHRTARQLETALEYAEQAVKIRPRNVRAQLTLARVLSADPDKDAEAAALLAKIVRDYPNSVDVHIQMGRLALTRKDAASAGRAFARALELDPDSTDALVELVRLDLQAGRVEAARRRVDAALAKRPDSPSFLLIAGKAYASIDPAVAERHLLKVVELDPSNIDAYETLAILYMGQRRLDQARAQFVALTEQQPASPHPPTMVGILTEVQGKKLEAEQWYEKALQINSRAATAANNLAWLWVQRDHNLEQALQLAETARTELPREPQVLDTLGYVAMKKGMTATAIRHFQDCVDQEPDNPEFRYHLGLALAQNGEDARARVSLQKALALNPNFPGAADAKKVIARLLY